MIRRSLLLKINEFFKQLYLIFIVFPFVTFSNFQKQLKYGHRCLCLRDM